MWRWHTPQDFCLHLLMNLKNNYLFKDLLKRTNKKCKNFKIQNDAFFLKNKEKHLETSLGYTCVMIYSSWDIECDRLKLLIMGHFLTLHPSIKARKKKEFWKNEKNCRRYHHFTYVYQKPWSKKTVKQVFSCELCKAFKNTFFQSACFSKYESLYTRAAIHSCLIKSCSENIWKISRSISALDCKLQVL